jgi:signal transduction histidine kinase
MIRIAVEPGAFGVVWTDADLTVRRTLGELVATVAVGRPIADSLLALFGQERRIAQLREDPRRRLHLANIAVRHAAAEAPRLRITLGWSQRLAMFVALVARVEPSDIRDAALENEIRKRRIADEALARINEQLEEFAYIISHDLEEPMRAIRYLVEDLAEALARPEPGIDHAVEAAQAVKQQSRRVSAMLVGLLEYSRVGREQHEIEALSLESLVGEIAASVAPRPGISIRTRGDLPVIDTVRAPLDMALRNLIANAVRHHDADLGEVVIQSRETAHFFVISVADDGPGIPREWQEAVFLPFRKIGRDENVESSGIGLALVRRAVESVGGRVELHSYAPATRGTRFDLHWPKRLQGR